MLRQCVGRAFLTEGCSSNHLHAAGSRGTAASSSRSFHRCCVRANLWRTDHFQTKNFQSEVILDSSFLGNSFSSILVMLLRQPRHGSFFSRLRYNTRYQTFSVASRAGASCSWSRCQGSRHAWFCLSLLLVPPTLSRRALACSRNAGDSLFCSSQPQILVSMLGTDNAVTVYSYLHNTKHIQLYAYSIIRLCRVVMFMRFFTYLKQLVLISG
jgi:hypothetical protein